MKNFNRDIGFYGECISAEYLRKKGYVIMDRNFRSRLGEIDIISQYNNLIIFIEVKSRYTDSYGFPMESVTCLKQKQIIKLSHYYLLINNLYKYNIRYDVIEIIFNKSNQNFLINHIQDAFRTY